MAVKTITIDTEAYDRLKKAKLKNESFSETIKRVVPEPFDLEAWFRRLEENPLSDDALDAIEEEVARRDAPINRERNRAVS